MKKRKFLYLFFILLHFFMAKSCFADKKNFHLAVGGGASFYVRQEYGESTFTQIAPEIVTYGYLPLYKSIWFRPGFRMNYSWQQPDMPKALRIEETDFRYSLETGILYDWIVIPSLSYSFGYIYRQTKFTTQYPITYALDDISGTENIPFSQFQLGLGFPILKGLIVFEPFIRYIIVQNDKRYKWGYGCEATFLIF
ncbi:hypothetical protein [Silvanigrella sp.]|jgi:hypothetical protein|uniref:hypothetical protein n=1 Tax=Silvanigrella sp. TaxID=2024976 RepID=UPI0037C9339A